MDQFHAEEQKHNDYIVRRNHEESVARGCPQGGEPSPLLWSLVVDELCWELNHNDYYTGGYADDNCNLNQG
jgi:hypothetical protein